MAVIPLIKYGNSQPTSAENALKVRAKHFNPAATQINANTEAIAAVVAEVDVIQAKNTSTSASDIYTTSVAIPSADITATTAGKLGHAEGVILVAAPATGYIYELVSATMFYDSGAAGYGAGGNITVNQSGGGIALTGLVAAANSLGAAVDKILQFNPLAATATAISVGKGLALVSSAAFTGAATGTIRINISYKIHETGL